ncbi:MAG: ParA family protein [Planctomycetia bacterium]|nr:ParA family protein [Planctomycetia bacterium]
MSRPGRRVAVRNLPVRIIAVVNQKGGVGKTTTSVNLGAGLALRGRRVLLVDMDPQGNLTDHLLAEAPPGTVRPSVYDVLVEGLPVAQAVAPTATPGLCVVPSHEDMAGCELDLASVIGREVLLRDALAELPADAWDFVFLDCPPSLGLLSLNALAAANEVFIALQTEFFAMRGLSALDRTIELVRRRINPQLVLGGIVPTLVDPTRLSREIMDEVRAHYGERVFDTRIRTNVRLAEAPSYGKHIFEYAPDCAGAADYASLAAEVDAGARAVPEAAPAAAAVAPAAPPTPSAPRAPAPAAGGSAAGVPAAATPPPAAPAKAPPKRGIAAAIAQAAAAVTKKLGAHNERPTQGPAADVPAAAADGAALDGPPHDGDAPPPTPAAAPEAEVVVAHVAPSPAAEPAPAPSAVATIDEPPTVAAADLEAHAADAADIDAAHIDAGHADAAHADAPHAGAPTLADARSVAASAVVAQALAAGAATVEPAPPVPSAADVPATEAPAAEIPAVDVPAAEAPAAEVPAADVPASNVSAADVPTAAPPVVAPAPEVVAAAAPRRPVPALPVLKPGRPLGLARMPLRPPATSRANGRPAP